jgi:hypothetical protein
MAAAEESNPGAPGHAGVGRDQRAHPSSGPGRRSGVRADAECGAGFPVLPVFPGAYWDVGMGQLALIGPRKA